jgi:hypothetical protein
MPRPTTVEDLCAILAQLTRQLVEALSDEPPTNLPPLQRATVGALTSRPQTAAALARKAGRKYNTNFRAALAALVRGGHARKTPDGYARA